MCQRSANAASRFIYTSGSDVSCVQRIYPNVRAVLSYGNIYGDGRTARKVESTSCRASLTILRPVRTATLVSLLEYPIRWARRPRSGLIHPIVGIDRIDIEADGALVGAKPIDGEHLFRNMTFNCALWTKGPSQLRGF